MTLTDSVCNQCGMKKVTFLRRSCHFTRPQTAKLEALAAASETYFADIVRRAVDEFLERQDKLVPRQGKMRRVSGQAKIQLEDRP